MAWRIEFDATALKQLRKLDRSVAKRIIAYLEKVAASDEPHSRGKALTHNLAGFWRYRIGDWRVICELLDDRMIIYALDIDHRSRIYRR